MLRNQHDVRVGDIFYHKTADSIQLWIWESDEGGLSWRAVRMGHPRSDGRHLSVTEKKLEPSWVCSEWCSKHISACTSDPSITNEPSADPNTVKNQGLSV